MAKVYDEALSLWQETARFSFKHRHWLTSHTLASDYGFRRVQQAIIRRKVMEKRMHSLAIGTLRDVYNLISPWFKYVYYTILPVWNCLTWKGLICVYVSVSLMDFFHFLSPRQHVSPAERNVHFTVIKIDWETAVHWYAVKASTTELRPSSSPHHHTFCSLLPVCSQYLVRLHQQLCGSLSWVAILLLWPTYETAACLPAAALRLAASWSRHRFSKTISLLTSCRKLETSWHLKII